MSALVYCECTLCECSQTIAIGDSRDSDEFGPPICERCKKEAQNQRRRERRMGALHAEADRAGLLAYRDPECRDRIVLVQKHEWALADLQQEVARPGGMRVGPEFIGTNREASAFIFGYLSGAKNNLERA